MKKLCIKCNQSKPVSQFYRRKVSKDGYQSRCKSCDNQMIKAYVKQPEIHSKLIERGRNDYAKSKDGLHHVYIQQDINYAGVTNSPKWRKTSHVTNKGANKEDFRVIYSSKSRDECLELEALLHDIGFEGRNANYNHR